MDSLRREFDGEKSSLVERGGLMVGGETEEIAQK